MCGLGEFRIDILIVVGATLDAVAVVVLRRCETSDLGKLSGHFHGRVQDWGQTTVMRAVLRVVGALTLLVPVRAGRDVLLLRKMVTVYSQSSVVQVDQWKSYSCEYALVGLITSDGLR